VGGLPAILTVIQKSIIGYFLHVRRHDQRTHPKAGAWERG
jgi:hypothetical protein